MTARTLKEQIAHLRRELLSAEIGGYCPRHRKAALRIELDRKDAQSLPGSELNLRRLRK